MLVMSEIEARRLLGVQSTSKANPTSDAKNKKAQERKLRSWWACLRRSVSMCFIQRASGG